MHIAWDDLQTIEALVRTGSVIGAGRELGLRHTSISRRIDALERTLGAALFLRGTRLRPTTLALELAAHASSMATHAREIEAFLQRERRTREARLVITTNDVLAPLVFGALAAHPLGRLVQVRISDEEAMLEPGVTDLALRPGAQPAGSLRGRRLGRLRLGIYRGRSLKRGTRDWILPSAGLRGRASMRWWKIVPEEGPAVVECDSLLAMRDACVAGLGRAALPDLLAVDDSRLVREESLEPGPPVWLLAPASRRSDPVRRRITEELAAGIRAREGVWSD